MTGPSSYPAASLLRPMTDPFGRTISYLRVSRSESRAMAVPAGDPEQGVLNDRTFIVSCRIAAPSDDRSVRPDHQLFAGIEIGKPRNGGSSRRPRTRRIE